MESAGARSTATYSQDMQELNMGKEQITNSIAGHKACLSNPNTTPAAKARSAKIIEELGGEATQEAIRQNPVSKTAAETLEGTPERVSPDPGRIRNDHESRTRLASLE